MNAQHDRPTEPPDSTDDDLTSELLESNPAFQALIAKSKASPSEPFVPGPVSDERDGPEDRGIKDPG